MFLEEYKTLRKELTKMQRTCDTLRLSNASLASSTTALDSIAQQQTNHRHHQNHQNHRHHLQQPMAKRLPEIPQLDGSGAATNSSSSSSRTTPKSILKNKNQATYVYRAGAGSGPDRRNSYHLLEPAPDDIYLS